MKKHYIIILIISVFYLYGCKGNKGKLTDKWMVKTALVNDPRINEELTQLTEEQNKTYYGSDVYNKVKALEDSVFGIRKKMQDFYLTSIYDLQSDGTAIVKRGSKEYKNIWEVRDGKDYFYVEIKNDGKLLEQWRLFDNELKSERFKSDGVFDADLNAGGAFSNGVDVFNVRMEFKRVKQ